MRRLLVVAMLCSAFLAGGLTAASAAAPVATGPMAVQLWPGVEPGKVIVIVSVTLSEEASLPATVQLPLFDGSAVAWAGEIAPAGGEDLIREATTKEGAGGRFAEFEVTTYRDAQVELSGVTLEQSADGYSAVLDYVQTTEAPTTGFSARLPVGASQVTIDPAPTGTPDRNAAGETLYTLPSKEMAPGDSQRVSVRYSIGAANSESPGSSDQTSVVIALAGLLVLAVVVTLLLLKRRSPASP